MASARQIHVGGVPIGGGAPVAVQTMTKTETANLGPTMEQIRRVAEAGADIVRVAVPEKKDTAALKEILPHVTVPIVADVHFHFQRALEAIDAGVHKIRLNPGNISDRAQVRAVIQACKAKNLPIRIGVSAAVAFTATSATLSRPPMLPGFSRMQWAPASIAFSARV